MRHTFLNLRTDIEWLFATHLKGQPLPPGKPLTECRSAIVFGNEDCPDAVELYWPTSPLAYEMPAAHFVRDEDGNLIPA